MRQFYACCFLLFVVFAFGQQDADIAKSLNALARSKQDTSRVRILNDLSRAYTAADSTKAMSYARQALALSENLKWREGISESYYRIATQFKARFKNRETLRYLDKSLAETPSLKQQSRIHVARGGVYMNESRYTDALASYHAALKIDESLRDKKGIATTAMNIASVYYAIKDYPKSIPYFNKAIAQKIDKPDFNAVLYRNLAAAHNSIGESHKALIYFEKSLALCEAIDNDDFAASLLSDIALTHYDLENYEKAIDYCKKSLRRTPKGVDDKINRAFSYGIIGDSYTEIAKTSPQKKVMLDSAFHYLEQSIALHKSLGNIRGLYDDYTSLTAAKKEKGDFPGALTAYENAMVYKDSIFNSDNRETIKNIEDKRAIEIRDRELKINRITLQAKERQKWFLILGIGLLSIIGFMLFYQSNSRKRANRRLNRMNAALDAANRTKTRLLSILNHDLRSPVNSFIHFIQFQKEAPDALDEATKKRVGDATLDSAKNLLESMEDILLWTKDQMEHFELRPEEVALDGIFADLQRHFSGVRHVALQFENPEKKTVNTDANYLKTILRNLISNSVKALDGQDQPTVTVRAFTENGVTSISVADNGIGGTDSQFRALFDEDSVSGVKSGLGLHLVRDLAKAIGWKIDWVSTPGEGTTITIHP